MAAGRLRSSDENGSCGNEAQSGDSGPFAVPSTSVQARGPAEEESERLNKRQMLGEDSFPGCWRSLSERRGPQ